MHRWSEQDDQLIRELRAQDVRWVDIAQQFGVTTMAAQAHGRQLGLAMPKAEYVKRLPRFSPVQSTNTKPSPPRAASHGMAAGHAVSWGAITQGTLLDGMPWPYAVEGEKEADELD